MEPRQVPAQEQRGGDKPDWDQVVAGEPLPERKERFPEPDSTTIGGQQLGLWPSDKWGAQDEEDGE